MKKVILILVALFWCNVGVAKIITIEKCYENTVKKETRYLNTGESIVPIIEEWGPNDKSWSEKSYEEYMNPKGTYDALAGKIVGNEKLDEEKITIDTESLILSFIYHSSTSPEVKKGNLKIIDYTDGIVFAEDVWDAGDTAGFAKYQINLNNNTIFLKNNYFYEGPGKSYMEDKTFTILCQPGDQSEGDIAGGASSGTAFFISNKGYLLTNNHVVKGCKVSKISYFNKEYKAKLIATDKTLDLALLKVKVRPKSYFAFSKDEPKKLQKIYVAGYPLGKGLSDDLKITTGIISALKGYEDNSNEIQVDAAINPGNSGGPIVNEKGELVAIAVSGLDKAQNINFGIKSSAAENFLKSNKVSPNKSLMSFSTSSDELLEILEESTVYTFCN